MLEETHLNFSFLGDQLISVIVLFQCSLHSTNYTKWFQRKSNLFIKNNP